MWTPSSSLEDLITTKESPKEATEKSEDLITIKKAPKEAKSSEETKTKLKSFYVCIRNFDHSNSWYRINHQPNNGEFIISRVDKLNKLENYLVRGYVSVALKSKIYFIGGYQDPDISKPAKNVMVYDVAEGTLVKGFPSMRAARGSHVAAILTTGDIYVFGHLNYLKPDQWAEWYCASTRKWNFLRKSPPKAFLKKCHNCVDGIAVHEFTSTIFIWKAFSGFFSYNYVDQKWNSLGEYIPCSHIATVVGNLLYWHFSGKIYAYDLVGRTMLPNSTDYPFNPSCSFVYNYLVDLGNGLLCRLCFRSSDGALKLKKFRISLPPHSGEHHCHYFPLSAGTQNIYIGPENCTICEVLELEELKMVITEEIEIKAGTMQRGNKEEVSKESMETTVMLIFYHTIRQYFVGGIIHIFEQKGFILKELRLMEVEHSPAQTYFSGKYSSDKVSSYIDSLTSGPVIVIVWEGVNVIDEVLKAIECNPFIIDKDEHPKKIYRYMIDASDSVETAKNEIKFWFDEPTNRGIHYPKLRLFCSEMIDPVESARIRCLSWFPGGPKISQSSVDEFYSGYPKSEKARDVSKFNRDLAFIIIRHCGVVNGFVGGIIHIFEKKGFILKGLKLMEPPETVVAMIWEGTDIVMHIRKTIRAKDVDISASWIGAAGSLVKVDRRILACFNRKGIPYWFPIKEIGDEVQE